MGPIQSGVNQIINTAAFGLAGVKFKKHIKNIEKDISKGLKVKFKTTPENAAKLRELDAQAEQIRSEGLPQYSSVDPGSVDTSMSDEELTNMVQNSINEMRELTLRPKGSTIGNDRAVEEIQNQINQRNSFAELKRKLGQGGTDGK